jgi:hypothetical protein
MPSIPIARRWRRLAVSAAAAALLAGCTVTGNGLHTSGLDRVVVGRTTLAQASEDLGAQPTDVWQQGDTVLARWAYKGTLATDAVYARQEVWLRFGPDGTFQRMENSVNLPLQHRPRTAAQADREAAGQRPPAAPPSSGAAGAQADGDGMIVIPGNGEPAGPVPVPPPAPLSTTAAPAAGAQPLLPAGSRVVPGATYPLSPAGR